MSGAKVLLFCRLSLFTKYHKMFKIAVSFSGGGSGNKNPSQIEVCEGTFRYFRISFYRRWFLSFQSPGSDRAGWQRHGMGAR